MGNVDHSAFMPLSLKAICPLSDWLNYNSINNRTFRALHAKCYCLPTASIFVTNMARKGIAVPDIDLESDQTTTDILLVFRGERPAVPHQHLILEVLPIMPEEEEQ